MLAVVDMAHSALAVAGVIVEAEPAPDELLRKACRLAERAGADYVVTSAGEVTARRTVQQTAVLRDSVGPRVQVKAAGRFRRLSDVKAAVAAGATRVSAELSAELAQAVAALGDDGGDVPGPRGTGRTVGSRVG
jgi:deoxyribose-phosphate aldolase